MSALSRFMRDNSPAAIARNREEWRYHVTAKDFRLTPYREDGTLDYGRQYVSYLGRGG